jgi:hypothetical protein
MGNPNKQLGGSTLAIIDESTRIKAIIIPAFLGDFASFGLDVSTIDDLTTMID